MAVPIQRIRAMLDIVDGQSRIVRFGENFIVCLIVLNITAIILESVETLNAAYAHEFYWFEVFSVGVFSVEFLFRLWLSAEVDASGVQALKSRFKYVFSPAGIIDIAAIAPFYLSMLTNIDLRFLRALRLLRIFKLTRYSPAMALLIRAIKREQQAINAAVFLLAIALVVASCGIYYCERTAQPDAFGSIPAAIWWAVATLTTVGYGDITPVTIGGKIFGALVMIVGVGMVALPTGILASTFGDELRRRREEFTESADVALKDGILTPEELNHLNKLRTENGLGRDEAERILRHIRSKNQVASDSICPHCHRSLNDTR